MDPEQADIKDAFPDNDGDSDEGFVLLTIYHFNVMHFYSIITSYHQSVSTYFMTILF